MSTLDDVREGLVDLWGSLSPFWGVTPTAGRVLAYLLGHEEPVDAETLAEGLGASRGSISMACRELADWGLVTTERPAGSRRVLYRPVTDLERAIRAIVSTRKRREWDPLLESLAAWRGDLERLKSSEAEALRARLDDVEAVVGVVDSMATSFLNGGTIQRLGLGALLKSARRRQKSKRR